MLAATSFLVIVLLVITALIPTHGNEAQAAPVELMFSMPAFPATPEVSHGLVEGGIPAIVIQEELSAIPWRTAPDKPAVGGPVAAAAPTGHPSGAALSGAQFDDLLSQAGYGPDTWASVKAVADCESHWIPTVIGDSGSSFGLLQEQPQWHQAKLDALFAAGAVANEDWLDPLTNLKVAYVISAGGHNFSAWTCRVVLG